jgi:hypothetical protein
VILTRSEPPTNPIATFFLSSFNSSSISRDTVYFIFTGSLECGTQENRQEAHLASGSECTINIKQNKFLYGTSCKVLRSHVLRGGSVWKLDWQFEFKQTDILAILNWLFNGSISAISGKGDKILVPSTSTSTSSSLLFLLNPLITLHCDVAYCIRLPIQDEQHVLRHDYVCLMTFSEVKGQCTTSAQIEQFLSLQELRAQSRYRGCPCTGLHPVLCQLCCRR